MFSSCRGDGASGTGVESADGHRWHTALPTPEFSSAAIGISLWHPPQSRAVFTGDNRTLRLLRNARDRHSFRGRAGTLRGLTEPSPGDPEFHHGWLAGI